MKHVSQIDRLDNLQALVRHELRELGVKVPKPKKAKRAASKLNQVFYFIDMSYTYIISY